MHSRPVFDFSLTAAKINLSNVPFASEWCVLDVSMLES